MSEPPRPATERLFFGAFPPEEMRRELNRTALQSPANGAGRPTKAANIHMTLRFLGAVPLATRDELLGLASELACEPFTLNFTKIDVWGRGGVMVYVATDVPRTLKNLVARLDQLAVNIGLPPETRAYRPHLTIARKAARLTEPRELQAPLTWTPNSFVLCRSKLDSQGALYTALAEYPIGG